MKKEKKENRKQSTTTVKKIKKKKRNSNNISDKQKTFLERKKKKATNRNPKTKTEDVTICSKKAEETNKNPSPKKANNGFVHNKKKKIGEDISLKETKDKMESDITVENKINGIDDERFKFDDVLWETFRQENMKKGIIYLPSIPLGMSISKMKEIFGEYGPIENFHLNKIQNTNVEMDFTTTEKDNKIRKYANGFIEYSDKKDAMKVEKLLNNKLVGGKKRKNLARDCAWHVKYLKGMTWNDITEHIIQRKLARKDKYKFAIKQMYKDYSNYIEIHRTKDDNIQFKKNADTNDEQTIHHNKSNPLKKINRYSKDIIIKDTTLIDPLEKGKQKIASGTNQKKLCTHISNQKKKKLTQKNKTISSDLAKLLL